MKRLSLFAALTLLLTTPACGPADEMDSETGFETEQVEQAATQSAGSTSEEFPPIHCGNRMVAFSLGCTGTGCDNVSMNCRDIPSNAGYGSKSWTRSFSEETTTPTLCPSGYWATGVSCTGSFCDNVSLECTNITGRTATDCYWSSWISDETAPFQAPEEYFIRGAKCRGWYCDDISLYYCKMG
ncbi:MULTISPECIES: hypothetical protein [Corallococcus]|uniref:hypothetical protein n=1 Tax=Corallococcus TaxID=83461 RepID=UPI000EDD6698|nr:MULTISPECIES: hypothetical protein [Corallococcus]NPD22218.1 hypothetical protein [Corallococcus exiguus]NRD46887.1 hypothetical protein [Corallococcus exiguus]RKI04660.1 hypothetical protein D7Y04_07010 [Corallococcus sp. AB038B]